MTSYTLKKEAKARWQQDAPAMTPDQIRAQRAQYFNHELPAQLSPEELRSYALRAKQHENFKRLGVIAPKDQELGMAGAVTLKNHAQVPNNTGARLRSMVQPQDDLFAGKWYKPYLPQKMRDAKVPRLGLPMDAHPMDSAVNRAVMDHEIAEQAAYRASKSHGLDQIAAKPLASHYSEAPLVAERISAFNQPRVNDLLDKLRALNPDDARVAKAMKQMGATPGAPMPMGGRAHRSLAKSLEGMPVEAPGARLFRLRDAIKPLEDGHRKMMPPSFLEHLADAPSTRYETKGLQRAAQVGNKINQGLDKFLPDAGKLRELYERAKPSIDRAIAPGFRNRGNAAAYLKHFTRI